jgi:hypothetical protein
MGLVDEDRKLLRNARNNSLDLNLMTKGIKNRISATLINLKEDSIESAPFYVQAVDYMREMNHCITYLVTPCYEHVENNHRPLVPLQVEEMSRINGEVSLLFKNTIEILKNKNFEDLEGVITRQQSIIRLIEDSRKKQIKRIKNSETGTRNSILYLNLLAEIKNMTQFTVSILKSIRDFEMSGKTKV